MSQSAGSTRSTLPDVLVGPTMDASGKSMTGKSSAVASAIASHLASASAVQEVSLDNSDTSPTTLDTSANGSVYSVSDRYSSSLSGVSHDPPPGYTNHHSATTLFEGPGLPYIDRVLRPHASPQNAAAVPQTQTDFRIEEALEALSEVYLTAVAALTSGDGPPVNDGITSPTPKVSPTSTCPLTLPGVNSRSTAGDVISQSRGASTTNEFGGQLSMSPAGTLGGVSPGAFSRTGAGSNGSGLFSFQKTQCFKTKACRFWQEKRCTRGSNCTFAHSDSELRERPDLTKTKICANWRLGHCTLSANQCTYAHGVEDLRAVDDRGDATPIDDSVLGVSTPNGNRLANSLGFHTTGLSPSMSPRSPQSLGFGFENKVTDRQKRLVRPQGI